MYVSQKPPHRFEDFQELMEGAFMLLHVCCYNKGFRGVIQVSCSPEGFVGVIQMLSERA